MELAREAIPRFERDGVRLVVVSIGVLDRARDFARENDFPIESVHADETSATASVIHTVKRKGARGDVFREIDAGEHPETMAKRRGEGFTRSVEALETVAAAGAVAGVSAGRNVCVSRRRPAARRVRTTSRPGVTRL